MVIKIYSYLCHLSKKIIGSSFSFARARVGENKKAPPINQRSLSYLNAMKALSANYCVWLICP